MAKLALRNELDGVVTSTYAYDLNGNMTSINNGVGAVGTRTVGDFDFTYNFANQTVTVKDGANITTSFAYDAMSNRSSATTGAVVNRFVWDKQNGLAQLALEKDGGTNSVTRRYVYGFDVISESGPDTTSFYTTDDIGTVTNVTAQAGNSQWAYDFTPFGKDKTATKIDPAAPVNPLKFTGQYQDPSSQYHLRARQYIPSIGRFTQTDPMPYGPGSAFEGSYVYTGNNPGRFVDPSGQRGTEPSDVPIVDQVPTELALTAGPSTPAHLNKGPHQAAVCLLPYNSLKCKRAQGKYRRLAEAAAGDARIQKLGSGYPNACRHAVWAALNSKTNGAGFTRALLHAHEQENDAWFTSGKSDTQADKINNAIGIRNGHNSSLSDSDLIELIKSELEAQFSSPPSASVQGYDVGSPC
jgi:RHS repeat-associated protein